MLIQNIKSTDISKFNYPFSLDVVALYTSIPQYESIQCLDEHLQSIKFNFDGLRNIHIIPLVKDILNYTYFTYKDSTYKQLHGLPMGNNLSGMLAIIFMDRL